MNNWADLKGGAIYLSKNTGIIQLETNNFISNLGYKRGGSIYSIYVIIQIYT